MTVTSLKGVMRTLIENLEMVKLQIGKLFQYDHDLEAAT